MSENMIPFVNSIAYKAEHKIGDTFSTCWFSKEDDSYLTHVGMEDKLSYLTRYGITEQIQSTSGKTANIGFNPVEQKWYGWSHRAIYGFGIGSEVKKGDCAYTPTNKDDFLQQMVNFWADEHHKNTLGTHTERDGVQGVYVSWSYNQSVPNKKLIGTVSGCFQPYPEKWGHGEWTAESLDDAKQMACDFAESVS